MAKTQIETIVENAIHRADTTYFFENYTKQARAVIKALEAEGFAIAPKEFPPEIWAQVAKEMRMGKVKPEEHVKDVYQTLLRLAAAQR